MQHNITITLSIDPTEYADVEDSLEGAKLIANEILFGAADLPKARPILIGQSNEPFVDMMITFLSSVSTDKELVKVLLQNLQQNKQQTIEAKEL